MNKKFLTGSIVLAMLALLISGCKNVEDYDYVETVSTPDSSTPSSTATDYELPDNTGTDTDGDGVCDIVERYVGTNLSIQDTDGDGYTDYEELYEFNYDPTNDPFSFSPILADVPEISISLASTPLVGLIYTTSEGETTEVATSHSSSTSQSTTLGGSVSVTVGVEQEINYSKDGVGGSTTGKVEVATAFSYEESQENSSTYEESESKSSESTISFESGYIKTSLNVINSGIIGYNLTNLILSALIIDSDEEEYIDPTPIDNLELSAGSFGITLNAGAESSHLVFSNSNLDLDTANSLLADAEGLILQVSGYQVTDDEGNTFTETQTEVNAKTAKLFIDYGMDAANENYLVATNIDRNDLGVSLQDVLDRYLYIPYETGSQGNITSIRGDSTENTENDQWTILHYYTDTGVDESILYTCEDRVDLSDITLKAGDCLYLVLVKDSDGDGTTDRIEAITNYGESEASDDYESEISGDTDTDGDGMADDIDNDPYYPNFPTAGYDYAAMIKTDGRLYNNGDSNDCYLDSDDVSSYYWKKISVGENHALGISRSGYLYGWGNDYMGSLGRGDYGEDTVKNLGIVDGRGESCNWIDIAASDGVSYGIMNDGTLWRWGFYMIFTAQIMTTDYFTDMMLSYLLDDFVSFNESNELVYIVLPYPCQLGDSADWEKIYAADDYAMAINRDGQLYAWGKNDQGQLGVGDEIYRVEPYQCSDKSSWKTVSLSPGEYTTADSDEWNHTLGIKEDGTLWAWGYNLYGQLGLGVQGVQNNKSIPTKVSDDIWTCVSAGSTASFGVKSDGTLWAWGSSDFGQLGIGNYTTDDIENTMKQVEGDDWCWVSAGSRSSPNTIWGMTTTGDLYVWGVYEDVQYNSPVKVDSIIVE